MLETLLFGLAVVGVTGLILRFVRSATRFVVQAAEAAAASSIAAASARRGDLTRLDECRETEQRARAAKRREGFLAGVWLSWLTVPLAIGAAPGAYALAAPLWLVRNRAGE